MQNLHFELIGVSDEKLHLSYQILYKYRGRLDDKNNPL
jgi:hypothetical protein